MSKSEEVLLLCSPGQSNCVARSHFSSGSVVVLNVGGQKHEVSVSHFDKFPNSRLWKMFGKNGNNEEEVRNNEELLSLCDRYRPAKENELAEFYFDRNYTGFVNILDAYRSGHLHLNAYNCAVISRDDLNYWGMDELLVEPCCAFKYFPEVEICQNELDMEETEKRKELEREKLEDFGNSCLGRTRKTLWDLFEYPHTSRGAQFIAIFSLSCILVSTACFILSCVYGEDAMYLGDSQPRLKDNSTNPEYDIVDDRSMKGNTVATVIFWADALTAIYFTVEYLVRIATTPRKLLFFIQPMNLIDLFAILPYFITFVVDHLSEFHIIGKAGKVVRLVRVTKVLRVFKLVRHFAGLQSLFFTIKQASRELGLLIMLIGVSVLTFSSLVYFAEKDTVDNHWTFMDSFWWGLLTITTIGNGEAAPVTPAGKFVGSVCAVCAVFTLILPIPIVVNNFTTFYRNRLWRNEVAMKKKERGYAIHQCAVNKRDGPGRDTNGTTAT